MKRKRFSVEQIVGVLMQAEVGELVRKVAHQILNRLGSACLQVDRTGFPVDQSGFTPFDVVSFSSVEEIARNDKVSAGGRYVVAKFRILQERSFLLNIPLGVS